jgi:alpha-L-arabinofuranosidase
MSSYAPLLVNENDVDWPVNLIHFNAAQSFGRISYYLIKMMNANRADVNLSFQTTIQKNKNTQPQFSGSIGLATWDTKAEYRDISVEQNGKILYQCDMLKHAEDWDLLRGNWQWRDSGLAQIAEGAQQFAMLKGKHFDTYTLRLKARKLDGYNAFIIPFAVKDSNTFMRMHIGAWWNKTAVIEQVENGYEVTDLSTHARLSKPVETNKWYDIRMEVGMDTVTCFLNDELIVQYAAPEKIFALAGRDKQKGDIIVKLVNAGADSALLQLSVPGITVGPLAEIITLAASAATAENSFALPGQYVPVRSGINIPGNSFNYQFKPYSITVLRIKEKQFYVKRPKR